MAKILGRAVKKTHKYVPFAWVVIFVSAFPRQSRTLDNMSHFNGSVVKAREAHTCGKRYIKMLFFIVSGAIFAARKMCADVWCLKLQSVH